MVLAVTLNVEAQITNSVYLTTNLLFSLHSSKTAGSQSKFKSNVEIVWGLLGTSTNRIWYRHFPSGNFDFHLFSENGNEVIKTKAGQDFSGTPSKPTKEELALTRQFVAYSVDNKQGEYRLLFRPDDVFDITNKGVYELEIQMRLCVIMTNNLPDMNAMIDARNVTGHGFPFAEDFGILTSPTLRVKVIKE